MTDLTFEPVAVRQVWRMPMAVSGDAWRGLLSDYLIGISRSIITSSADRPCVIGHIKLLATFDKESYFRISVVDATHAPTCDGNIPDGLGELVTTLNVLVFGLSGSELERVTWSNAEAAAALGHGQVIESKQEGGGDRHHSHHHGDAE